MEGVVERLQCRYRVLGDAEAAARALPRLQDASSRELAAALERALDQALAGDPSVYVLRRVHSTVALAIEPDIEEASLAALWGERLAGSVVRSLASPDPENLVRFEDQADYVARFIVDLLSGQAWEHWYYLAFEPLRSRPRDQALMAVLLDHREDLLEILARLDRYGALDGLLRTLPASALTDLWLLGLVDRNVEVGVGIRALFTAAVALIPRLGLAPLDRATGEALFRGYRERRLHVPSWHDASDLARAVAQAFSFLLECGAMDREALREVRERIPTAVSELDWLDRDDLTQALEHLADGAITGGPRPPRHGITPRQRRLLADLKTVLQSLTARLETRQPDSPANALRVAAALSARSGEWRGDPLATELIAELLRAWTAIRSAAPPQTLLQRLEQGDPGAVKEVLQGASDSDRQSLARLLELGGSAIETLGVLLDTTPAATDRATPVDERGEPATATPEDRAALGAEVLETPVAGIFLLLRALNDLRLPALIERVADVQEGSLSHGTAGVLAVALRWAGRDDSVGQDLARLVGTSSAPPRDELQRLWLSTDDRTSSRIQDGLVKTVLAHRLAEDSAVRLFDLYHEGSRAVVLQLGRHDLWPLGRLVGPDRDRADHVAAVLTALQDTCGVPASASADDGLLDLLPEMPGWAPWNVVEPSDEATAAAAHSMARQRLLATLDSLSAGTLVPDRPHEIDLTFALTAAVVLRAWARWLKRLEDSSVPFLLREFVRRPGRLYESARGLHVELERAPFDLVLELSGYLAPLELPDGNTLTFGF